MKAPHLEILLPGIANTTYRIVSSEEPRYNCIAFAASKTDRFWWPSAVGPYYWPLATPRDESTNTFVEAFQSIGFESCGDGEMEAGFEKVAFFAINDRVKHAARQLRSGKWVSKLGRLEDIEHELHAVESKDYGKVIAFMKRPIP
ncbi:MAG: hypothetical protein IIA14_00530 [SAR324 cluster bacterium]|nr:hypothetical protein [SAR324 cluster bacterium]